MKKITTKKFDKDIKNIKQNKKLFESVKNVFRNIEQSKTLEEIKGVLKLKGYKNLYRIKTSDLGKYRIVFSYENDEIILILVRVLHRKEIYEKLN